MADSTVFEGIGPGAHEGMVELKDGRWMMVQLEALQDARSWWSSGQI